MPPQQDNSQNTMAGTDPAPQQGPMPTVPTPVEAQPPMPQAAPARKLVGRYITIAVLAVVVILLVAVGYFAYARQAEKAAGLKKADEHVALLEAGDMDALQSELLGMLNVDANDPNPGQETIQEVTGAAIQTAFIAEVLKETDASRYSDSFGITADGKKLVTAYYKFDVNGKTGYYVVSVRKEASQWTLHSVSYTTDADPAAK